MATASELHILAPALLGPVPGDVLAAEAEPPRFPAMEVLLARGDLSHCAKHSELLAIMGDLLELEPVPAGPIALLGAGGVPADGYWFRAAPVHLRPDRDRLLLLGGGQLQPRAEEARILLGEFNTFFQGDGLELVEYAGEWFLRAAHEPAIRTESLECVCNRYLDAHLPSGPQARRWIAFLNESQMLFHASRVNREREARGELPLNGLWIWGGGRLPRWDSRSPVAAIHADALEARGVAGLLGIESAPAAEELAQIAPVAGPTLVVWPQAQAALQLSDFGQWRWALAAFEEVWAAQAVAALRDGRWQAVHLHIGHGRRWRINPADLRRFWRRRRSLIRWLTQEA